MTIIARIEDLGPTNNFITTVACAELRVTCFIPSKIGLPSKIVKNIKIFANIKIVLCYFFSKWFFHIFEDYLRALTVILCYFGDIFAPDWLGKIGSQKIFLATRWRRSEVSSRLFRASAFNSCTTFDHQVTYSFLIFMCRNQGVAVIDIPSKVMDMKAAAYLVCEIISPLKYKF